MATPQPPGFSGAFVLNLVIFGPQRARHARRADGADA